MTLAKRIAVVVLVLGFLGGLAKYGMLVTELSNKRREWAEIERENAFALPPPGFINVRCLPGDRAYHWVVEVRCRDAYHAYFHHATDGFHSSKMKFVGGLHNMETVQLDVGKWEQRPSLLIPAGGYARFEVRFQESSLGNTLVCFRGLDARYPCVTNIGGISTAARSMDELTIRFPMEKRTVSLPVDEPFRLFDFGPTAEYSEEGPIVGLACIVFPSVPTNAEMRELTWERGFDGY